MVTEKIKQEFNEKKQDLVGYIMYYFRDEWNERINGGKGIDDGTMIRLWDTTYEKVEIAVDDCIEAQFCEHYIFNLQISHQVLIKTIDDLFTVLLQRFTLEDISIDNRNSKEREINEWVKTIPGLYSYLFKTK